MLRKIDVPSTNVESSVEFILRGAKKRRSMALASANMLNSNDAQTLLVAIKQSKRAEAAGLAAVQDRNAVNCERSDRASEMKAKRI